MYIGKVIIKMSDNDVQNDILSAAAKIFIEKGKSGARMQEIANEAGVNKMLLHYYFKNKDLLFHEVLKSTLIEFYNSVFRLSFKETSFKENLALFIDRHFEFLYEKRNVLGFLSWEFRNNEKEMREMITNIFQKIGDEPIAAFSDKLREAAENGEIRQINARDFMLNIYSLNAFFFIALPLIHLFEGTDEKDIQQLLENRKKEIFRLLWNDIKA